MTTPPPPTNRPYQILIDADQIALIDALAEALSQHVIGVPIKPSRTAIIRIALERGCQLIADELQSKQQRKKK